MSRWPWWITLVILFLFVGCAPVDISTPTPAPEPAVEEIPADEPLTEETATTDVVPEGPTAPVIYEAHFVQTGTTVTLEIVGQNFVSGNAVYVSRGMIGNGEDARVFATVVDSEHLTIDFPIDRLPDECTSQCTLIISVIYGVEGSVSDQVNLTYSPEILSAPTATPTPTPIPTGTPQPEPTATPESLGVVPIRCGPSDDLQVWAWLPSDANILILARPDTSPKYNQGYLLIRWVDNPEFEGWMKVDNISITQEQIDQYPRVGENNRCYSLSEEMRAEQDNGHIWVVTNPDLNQVAFLCAPNPNASIRAYMQEQFILVEARQGGWFYGKAINVGPENAQVYGWINGSQLIPRTVPIGVPEIPVGAETTHC